MLIYSYGERNVVPGLSYGKKPMMFVNNYNSNLKVPRLEFGWC